MIKYFLFALAILSGSIASSQTAPKYHRIKVLVGQNGLLQMAQAGIAVDHGESKKGVFFTSDFSDAEFVAIKNLGLSYEVQIDDVSAFYENRNKQADVEKPFGAEGCDVCDVYATPLNFQLGTMGGFYKYQEFLDALDSMHSKYPDLITVKAPVSTTLTTIEGRPLYYVKLSDNAAVAENEPQVLYTALHHAREAESLSQLIFYMWYLLDNYATNDYVKYLVDHTEMYFVPMINPDGYVYNQTTNPNGGGMWRKNRRNNGNGSYGVDLNRNYGQFWGYDNLGSSPDGTTDVYRGTAGFSEAETQMIRDFCNEHDFLLALNAHTYSDLLIYPWGHVVGLETADSNAFRHFAKDMASCSGFITGTGDQTVGYVTNGDSDDWMYGEQTSKNKIFSMTPEAGKPSDGFWPTLQRIIPIAKQTLDQNLDLAKYATPFAEVVCTDGPILPLGSKLHFKFTRTGLTNSNFTVTFTQLLPNSGITINSAAKVFNSPAYLTSYTDSIELGFASGVPAGQMIRIAMKWENAEGFSHTDTVEKYFGTPVTAFSSSCDNLSAFEANSGWGISTNAIEGAGSITDSPNGDYAANATKPVTTLNTIDLTNATAAFLSFDAKWELERGFDDVTVEAAEDGGSYNVLCGRYSHLGNTNQSSRKAVYDGIQNDWVKEYIDLKDYLGKKVKIRYVLHTDQATEMDGFYFDDMKVEILGNTVGIRDLKSAALVLQNVPNPSNGNTKIIYQLPKDDAAYYLIVTDQTGRTLKHITLDKNVSNYDLNLSVFGSGLYFYKVVSDNGQSSVVKKMIVVE